ncbi:MAG TPA: EVE domain-containing protein [Polyangia bacterium]|jgi:predicted RNA-binding protein with PUA-like domain|nr:EVE domain-containing protein [Polyangia bacterium]
MAYWLLKTEPSTYSFADLVREKQTRWDGIRNPTALQHLRAAKRGDRALVYHTGSVKAAVGEAVLASAAYDDPKDPALSVIDLQAGKALAQPVTLAQLKADPLFAESPLVKMGRLSFVPLTDAQWKRVQTLAKKK